MVWLKQDAHNEPKFIESLNSVHAGIRVTHDAGKLSFTPFLELLIENVPSHERVEPNEWFKSTVFVKPTATGCYIDH